MNIRILIVSYLKVEDARDASNYLMQQKLNENYPTVKVSYIYDEKQDNLLSSINESANSDKSDQEGNDKKEPQEENKEEQKFNEETRYFTPFKPRQRTNPKINLLTSSRKDLNMTVCIDREDLYFFYLLFRRYYQTQRTYSASFYNTPTGSGIHTETTTNIDSDEALSSSGRTDIGASLYSF